MARGLIANAVATVAGGLVPTETTGDAVNFHYFRNGGDTRLFVRNSGAVARIVTIYISKLVAGQSVVPITLSLPAGTTYVFGPYSLADFGSVINVDVAHAELMLRTVD